MKVCSSVPGGVTLPYLDLSAGVKNPSAFSGCGSGSASNWSKIGRKAGKGISASGYLVLKAVVLKGLGEGVRHVHLLDSLPTVCTFPVLGPLARVATIPCHVVMARWKTDGPQTDLLSASP